MLGSTSSCFIFTLSPFFFSFLSAPSLVDYQYPSYCKLITADSDMVNVLKRLLSQIGGWTTVIFFDPQNIAVYCSSWQEKETKLLSSGYCGS